MPQQTPDSDKTINFATTFQEPIHALLDGRPVTLLATGDVAGMSPAFQYVDQQGKTGWAKTEDIRIYDQRALPAGADTQVVYQQATSGLRR